MSPTPERLAELSRDERDRIMLADGWTIERERNGNRKWFRNGRGMWDQHCARSISATACDECGDHYEVKAIRRGSHCFTCRFWFEQLDDPEGAVVTEDWWHKRDNYPRPLHGGLWVQGQIPEHMRHYFEPRRGDTDRDRLRLIGES